MDSIKAARIASISTCRALGDSGPDGLTEGVSRGWNPVTSLRSRFLMKCGKTDDATVVMPGTRTVADSIADNE